MLNHNHWYKITFADRGPVITFAETGSDAMRKVKSSYSGMIRSVEAWGPDNCSTFKGISLSDVGDKAVNARLVTCDEVAA